MFLEQYRNWRMAPVLWILIANFSAWARPDRETAVTLNHYQGHGIFASGEGLEPAVVIDQGKLKLWYHHETYLPMAIDLLCQAACKETQEQCVHRCAKGPEQAKNILVCLKQGTPATCHSGGYPFAANDIYYREVPLEKFESAVLQGTPIPWENQGVCLKNYGNPYVARGPEGQFDMLVNKNVYNGFRTFDHYRSPTGLPGSWDFIANVFDAGQLGFTALGNLNFFWDNDHWNVFLDYYYGSHVWETGFWAGPSLKSLTRHDSLQAPAFPSTHAIVTSIGEVLPQTYQGKWVGFGHKGFISGTWTPTDISFYHSDKMAGPWTSDKWVIRLGDLKNFMGDPTKPFDWDSQIADPVVFEYNHRTYIIYETIWHELYEIPSLAVSWWDVDLNGVIADLLKGENSTPTLEN